jgi:positive regulator of sigma E activity
MVFRLWTLATLRGKSRDIRWFFEEEMYTNFNLKINQCNVVLIYITESTIINIARLIYMWPIF